MARHLHVFVLCLLLLLMAVTCHADQNKEHFIDRMVVQYAGMLGMFSLGVENTTGSHSDFQFMAGYTPAAEAGIDIYSVGLRGNYVFNPLLDDERGSVRLYSGMGLYYYFGEQYQTYKYPHGYYTHPATEWHLMPYLGIRYAASGPLSNRVFLYGEAGIIDAYLIHYYNNYQTIDLGDVISLALGVSVPLR